MVTVALAKGYEIVHPTAKTAEHISGGLVVWEVLDGQDVCTMYAPGTWEKVVVRSPIPADPESN